MILDDDLPEGLLDFLQREEARAEDSSLNEERAIAIDFYNGKPFGDEEEGRSQLVTRDVAEVVDYMTVAILGTMVSGNRVVEFKPREEDQADAADDQTELVQWQFMVEQPGYFILHDFLKAGLLEKSGVTKSWAEPTWQTVEEPMPASAIDALYESGDTTIIDFAPIKNEVEVLEDPFTGEQIAEQVYAVRRKVPGPVKFRDAAVPNEEFRVSPEARSLDEAAYIQHKVAHPLSWFIEAGYADSDAVNDLWGDDSSRVALSDARDNKKRTDDPGTGLNRQVWLSEEYVRWDADGDGIAERLCIYRVGRKFLKIEPVEDQPFVLWTPFPMQHRLIGQSLADKTMDIQRTRSVLLRQFMDALYFANSPRIAVNMDQTNPNTLDDILSIIPGAPIRYSGVQPPTPIAMPFAAANALSGMELMTGERESRTGVTKHNQGLNPDSLNKTASGMAMLRQAGDQIQEYLARNFAEGVAALFAKKAKLMKRYGSAVNLRVGGEFKQIDPAQLDGEMDMSVSVGLGSGRKDLRLQHRFSILGMQKEAYASGSALVDEDKLYSSAKGIVEDAQLGDVNQYFNDPNAPDPETGQPKEKPQRRDPAEIEAEGKAAAALAKVQSDADLARLKLEADIENERARAEFEAELARDKANFEADMARERMAFERSMSFARNSLPADRPGGSLAA